MREFQRSVWLVGALLSSALLGIGCTARQPSLRGATPAPFVQVRPLPKLTRLIQMRPGVLFGRVSLHSPKGEQRVMGVYLPEAGMKRRNLPCVVIAPAGTRLFHGIDLGDGDVAEHLPYVKAGYMVVAYTIDGALSESQLDDPKAVQRAQTAFLAAEGGIQNGKTAIQFALEELHADPKRIVVAGHSSAATLALQLAAHDSRVTACIAYAPCTDLPARLGEALPALEQLNPGAQARYQALSPKSNLASLKCPVFLFHARDDSNVPFSESESFVQALKQAGGKVTFVPADSGNHYDSMVRQGIPAAQKWLSQRFK